MQPAAGRIKHTIRVPMKYVVYVFAKVALAFFEKKTKQIFQIFPSKLLYY